MDTCGAMTLMLPSSWRSQPTDLQLVSAGARPSKCCHASDRAESTHSTKTSLMSYFRVLPCRRRFLASDRVDARVCGTWDRSLAATALTFPGVPVVLRRRPTMLPAGFDVTLLDGSFFDDMRRSSRARGRPVTFFYRSPNSRAARLILVQAGFLVQSPNGRPFRAARRHLNSMPGLSLCPNRIPRRVYMRRCRKPTHRPHKSQSRLGETH
jgi:hypothetical protein